MLPFEPTLFGVTINVHLILEYLAFFIGFRYYIVLRRRTKDTISSSNRLSIIIGAVFGALFFSRIMAFLEDPYFHSQQDWIALLNNKTIMGGLFGGLLGVELSKKIIGEKQSSGDLFALPIILGIIIGRIGCFLAGTTEFTYGKQTAFFLGMDLGDGLQRHPIALYEVVFLLLLCYTLRRSLKSDTKRENGLVFKQFMILYFAFRFLVEFLKPNTFLFLGLSSIQYLCLICWVYYHKTIARTLANAREKLHLL